MILTGCECSDLWEKLVRRTVVFLEEEAPADALGWKDLACLVSRPEDRFVGLLDAVIGEWSSVVLALPDLSGINTDSCGMDRPTSLLIC